MKKGSVKPKNTDETISSCNVPGAKESASPTARNTPYDGSLVDGNRSDSARKEHDTTQVGGHSKK